MSFKGVKSGDKGVTVTDSSGRSATGTVKETGGFWDRPDGSGRQHATVETGNGNGDTHRGTVTRK